ncbi:MAG: thrombospondin type 3 repeat-containing protein, partial [Gammaproteobacteria bacterium]|nr:thrombospondin type 3 repeat-containing protein [Gammaproteobacteria bacterium]
TSATEAVLYSYSATVTDADDLNNGTDLIWSLSNAPTGMTVSSFGVVSWTPANGVSTSGAVTLSVADGGENGAIAATETFTIAVTAVNTPPSITSTAGTSATEAVLYSYSATVTDADDLNNGTDLIWSLSNAPTGMTVSSLGVVSWTPANGVSTSGAVTLSVADGGENGAIAATETFTIAVANVNSTGVATITGSANEGQLLNAGISDADGISNSTFSYQWKRGGSNISGATANTYTLALADVGSAITVTIGYTDDQGTVESITSAATGIVLSDFDADGIADINDPDDDNDGVLDTADAFPFDASESADADGDGVGDNADAFPSDASETLDSDGDNVGDNTDLFPLDASESADSDGDGVGDNADAFPNDASESLDTDSDNIGNNTDADDDNDGLPDLFEIVLGLNPLDASDAAYDLDADMYSNLIEYAFGSRLDDFTSVPAFTLLGADSDGDGIPDSDDAFPNDPDEFIDSDGDGIGNRADTDDDDDGVSDNFDQMPLNDSEVDDSDGDNVGDNSDAFPLDASESKDTDADGVGDNSDPDADGDGVDNSLDAFPLDATESVDSDGDGVGDNADALPTDPTETVDTDNDGIGNNADTDDDNDSVLDDSDNCPLVSNSTQQDSDGDGIGNACDVQTAHGGGSFGAGVLLLSSSLLYLRRRQQKIKVLNKNQ